MKKMALWSLIATMVLVAPAFGHAKLLSSAPAADAQVTGSPGVLTLTFNENVRLGALKLSTGGHDLPITIDRAAAGTPTVTVRLPALTPGKYEVQWSALTLDDGHVVKGGYSFSVL